MGLDADLQEPIRAMLEKAQNPAEKSRQSLADAVSVDFSVSERGHPCPRYEVLVPEISEMQKLPIFVHSARKHITNLTNVNI